MPWAGVRGGARTSGAWLPCAGANVAASPNLGIARASKRCACSAAARTYLPLEAHQVQLSTRRSGYSSPPAATLRPALRPSTTLLHVAAAASPQPACRE